MNKPKSTNDLIATAESGDCEAQTQLGVCFTHGIGGMERDEVAAAAWFRRAAQSGHAAAQYFLGRCHLHGKGVERDTKRALELFEAAAQQNHSAATLELATWYATPENQGFDRQLSTELFIRAAELTFANDNDDEDAGEVYRLVAGLYERGEGTQADPQKAALWRKRSEWKMEN